MRLALLRSAVAMRNMGLQSKVEALQQDEAEARMQRAHYLEAKAKLEAGALAADEQAALADLAGIDTEMEGAFKEAVELASLLNTEQAGAIITGRIDPLLKRASEQLAGFIALQERHDASAGAEADRSIRNTVGQLMLAAAAVFGLSALLAWRLTLSITQPLRVAVQASAQIAAGNLCAEIESEGDDEAAQLLAALRAMRDALARMVTEVRAGSAAIHDASGEIASGNADLSSRTEAQASALQQTAASVEELTAAVKNNADSSAAAQHLAQEAHQQTIAGHGVVGEVISTMGAINDNARRIGDITSVINGIAFQTNILALNAAVEAARAGEHGRGFAVVAAEVRALSQHTTQAAKEIAVLIQAAVERTQSGTELAARAGSAMDGVMHTVRKVSDIVSAIGLSTQEQSRGIAEVNAAIADIDRGTQQNAAMVEEAAAAAAAMREQTTRLHALVGTFQV
jgi:methyl-accepting chemotaxis protein